MAPNYKQIYAIKKQREKFITSFLPGIENRPGIYIYHRVDSNGFKSCYVGQSVGIIDRLISHMGEYDHIALSLKKHGYQREDNPFGWQIDYFYCDKSELDDKERETLAEWHINKGYAPYNRTTGGQDGEKQGLDGRKPAKGYRDGIAQGYKNARRDVSKLFEKNLTYSINGKDGKLKQRAYEKFTEFLNVNQTEEEDEI